eukprot:Platyproteum_vivax@DN6558_c0_g1_i5.p1
MEVVVKDKINCFGGKVLKCEHLSPALGGLTAKLVVFQPGCASKDKKVPQVWWLSGLTCTENNFTEKAGAFRKANELGLMLVIPDTSPRGANVQGEDERWEVGTGAAWYLNATTDPWKKHYRMYDYVTKDLPEVVKQFDFAADKKSICGHSMGGHGAITIALKNPGMFQSCSAMAPVSHPTECPWGHLAFPLYLGNNKEDWKQYDATCLVQSYSGPNVHLFIDQGLADDFLEKELLTPQLVSACKAKNLDCFYRSHEGYNHSFFFIQTFIDDHLQHHAKFLK